IDSGTGSGTAVIAGSTTPLIVGAVKITGGSITGESATLTLAILDIRGGTTVSLGDGALGATIDNITARGAFVLISGTGGDTINIERGNSLLESNFRSIAVITTGAGSDTINIGNNSTADKAVF